MLHVADPNPSTRVTGYVIHRGAMPTILTVVASDLADEGAETPGARITDPESSGAALLFYRVTAINTLCGPPPGGEPAR